MFTRRMLVFASCLFALGAGISYLAAAPTREEAEVERYTKTLKTSKKTDERVTALKELGKYGAIQVSLVQPAIPEIVRALDDKEARVRAEAAHTIGKIDPENKKEIVEKLTRMLKEDKEESVRRGAAAGLAAMGGHSSSAVPALREAFQKAGKKDGRPYQDAIMAITGKRKN